MKLGKIKAVVSWTLAAVGLLSFQGCSGGGGANIITMTVTASGSTTLIVGTTLNLTATVTGGATNLASTWVGCFYTIIPANSTTRSGQQPCPSDGSMGTLTNEQTATPPSTATYNAPNQVPDQTKFPALQIVIIAKSVQDPSKTASITLTLVSGIQLALTPATAAVPTKEPLQFHIQIVNDLQNKGVTWLVMQPTTKVPIPMGPPFNSTTAPSCSAPGKPTDCGSISSTGLYTAPPTIPVNSAVTTPADVTVLVYSNADNTQFTTGTITVTQGGPITFNGISPTIAPQGATLWDIFLDAPNVSSASVITLTGPGGSQTALTSDSGQVKILFPLPTSATTNPTSNGARIRLNADNLASAGAFTVSISDPAEPVTQSPNGAFTYNVLPARPTVVASVPDDVIQGTLDQNTKVSIDGGYFGPSDKPLAQVIFRGNTLPQNSATSNSRLLDTTFPAAGINSGNPGLYPISVVRTSAPAFSPAVTNLAVFPDYSTVPPQLLGSIPAGTNPSAIDIDPDLGVIAVALTGANAVQFYSVGPGTLTPLGAPVPVGQVPTGLSINRSNHTVGVVNYIDQSVTVLPIPGAPQQAPGTPFTVSLSGLLPLTPTPLPYAIGVDPDTNMALVAYSSAASPSTAEVGFIVNLNPGSNSFGCLGDTPPAKSPGPCVYAQVTLNTGIYPQIAVAPHGHLAIATPGGSGVALGIDVTKASTSVGISTVSLSSGIVTVTTSSAHNLNPGNPGTVLIEGVKSASGKTIFNGAFPVVAVISTTQFTYSLPSTTNDTGSGGTVSYSFPNVLFGGPSQTSQGIAINPITQTAAIADPNATSLSQINLLNGLDQSISSISFSALCTFYTTNCSSAPEIPLGTADVAWQPFSNAVVSYNPSLNQVSVSDPVSQRRYAFACNATPGTCITNPMTQADQTTFQKQITLAGTGTATLKVQNGTNGQLTLWGGLAVDLVTNQAFVVMSGSNQIDIIDLGPNKNAGGNSLKPAQISDILVPSPSPAPGAIGGIPNAVAPQATLGCIPTPPASPSVCDLPGVQIFGSGFDAGTQVRLDGVSIPAANVQFVSTRKLVVTIPGSFLSTPHRFALDAINSAGSQSNATDFIVVTAVDLSKICQGTVTQPSGVAIADQLANGNFSPIAVVTDTGCGSISVIDINPANINPTPPAVPSFGTVLSTIAVGKTPTGVAISQRLGLAVVANNGDNTASIVNLLTNKQFAGSPVSVGTQPTGVAINDSTSSAIIANTGSNSISEINLSPLFASPPATSLTATPAGGMQQPIAVAIDPDRGTNNLGIAVVSGLQLQTGSAPLGALYVVDIGLANPVLSSTAAQGSVTATPTGIVFDPTVATNTTNPGVFYTNSSGANVISSFNPDTGTSTSVSVGINPTSLAINPQTGAILTSNFVGQSISIVDTVSSPLKTRETLGIPGSPQFGLAIDPFTNLAAIVDQVNNRLLIFQMPN
jgi:hypothetical protein